ncbi:MAG: methylenetetrahydrofolate--tRNA-(uracil(54)-C(5))-methyltransferase (FADH(2)-oxidizing) TrmFO [Candidatus Eisenbacteria bacterium]|nr:methylenetetrahydrofolate--tRNA-(uracil(54)-C(5))-methyltransferase (FADH(2)-oxidizing) TrmFO [Candidatus Eisenbacteria bacterium]
MKNPNEVVVVGGGLAGSEAAFQASRRGVPVVLYEMRPGRMTEAHGTGRLAELVCSNSLKSDAPGTAAGLLKAELRAVGSGLMAAADATRVPAGTALAVDRVRFSEEVERMLRAEARVRVVRQEVNDLDPSALTVVATGPLTSQGLSDWIRKSLGRESLFFYDAISPIVDAGSVDLDKAFGASRYGKGDGGYLNCPLDEAEFGAFREALLSAELASCREFDKIPFFEGCLPVEEVARRGRQALAFGAMKPVGLTDPRTGRMPYAVVQLRPENRDRTMYGMVGFQTRLKVPDQRRVFRMIPGLERAQFLRYGSVHRNSFINSPECLLPSLQTRLSRTLFVGGQLSGVEGYAESIATGLLAGLNAARLALGLAPVVPPPETAIGSLCRYVAAPGVGPFQPMNFNFGLLPPLPAGRRRAGDRKGLYCSRAREKLTEWLAESGAAGTTAGTE